MGERVEFESASGHTLAGLLDLPDGEARAFLLFAHCFTCGKNLKLATNVARRLNDEGIGVLRFDFTGLGESEGAFAETTFSTNLADLKSAAAWLERAHKAPSILFGHSLGGAAVLAVADELPSVRCVATVGAPAEPVHVRHLITASDFDADGTTRITIGGRPFRIRRDFVEDLERHDLLSQVADLRLPLLLFHSPVDRVVGIENAERLYHAARHPKSYVSLGDADHLVSDSAAARFMGDVLAAWAGYYVSRA